MSLLKNRFEIWNDKLFLIPSFFSMFLKMITFSMKVFKILYILYNI